MTLDATRSAFDYPRNYTVEISDDGEHWSQPILQGTGNSPVLELVLPPIETRHVRISQHGRATGKYWSIHELEVFEEP